MKNVINEAGLYRLVMRSTKTEAKAFQKWVTGTVLPSIRKNGLVLPRNSERVARGSPFADSPRTPTGSLRLTEGAPCVLRGVFPLTIGEPPRPAPAPLPGASD